jgi:aspartyl-tRNA(Asn)/glutamyl-tRNA(Gln) amidotransferase subunit C
MVDVFDRLRQVNVDGLEPTSHSVPVHNVWREDRVVDQQCGPELLQASIQARDGLFIVPAILDDGE